MSTQEIVEWLYQNAQQGNWRIIVAGVLSATVWFLRTGILRPGVDNLPVVGKLSAWLKTDRGGVTLALAVGVLGGIGTALGSSHAVTLPLILSGVVNGVLGAGVFNVAKRAIAPADKKDDAPPSPPRIPITMLAFTLAFVGGCASGEFMYRYDQATATAAVAAMTCKDTLSDVNATKLTECRNKLTEQKDVEGAQTCLNDWRKTYDTADTACKALKLEAQTAQATRGVVAAAATGKKDAAEWVARLAAAGAKVFEVFTNAGISLGGK